MGMRCKWGQLDCRKYNRIVPCAIVDLNIHRTGALEFTFQFRAVTSNKSRHSPRKLRKLGDGSALIITDSFGWIHDGYEAGTPYCGTHQASSKILNVRGDEHVE